MTVEEAVQRAMETVKSLFGGGDHRLEEIELKGDNEFEVTISFRSPDAPSQPFVFGSSSFMGGLAGRRTAIGIDASRTYKDVIVGSDGQIKAVRMRQIVLG